MLRNLLKITSLWSSNRVAPQVRLRHVIWATLYWLPANNIVLLEGGLLPAGSVMIPLLRLDQGDVFECAFYQWVSGNPGRGSVASWAQVRLLGEPG
jgi:hypothetical protein